MRREKMLAEQKLNYLSQEVRELNDKLEYTRVMPVKDREITSLESRLCDNLEKLHSARTKISSFKPDFESLTERLNRKWGHLTSNASTDLQSVCQNESVRIHYYDSILSKVNSIFIDALTNHGSMFTPSGNPDVEINIDTIKKRNEFGKRCIAGFPISWFSELIYEPSFDNLMRSFNQQEISSPFYNM